MKRFKVYYKEYGTENIVCIVLGAMCEDDAIDYFFENIGGQFVRCELVK